MTGDDHVALAGALVLAFLAVRGARRWFRALPDYCVTPLGPEVRPESAGFAAHADEAMALCDPIGALFDEMHDQAVEFAAVVMETIHALPETETTS